LSKKKFTDGLESLFGESPKEVDQKGNFLLFPVEQVVEEDRKEIEKGVTKNFSSDLDSFLKEAFDEAFDENPEQTKSNKPAKKSRKSLSGLDALIRSTIEPHSINFDKKRNSKRITFLVDKDKLDKLKEIAKQEKTFLKDIISSIVEEYVSKYETEK